MAGEGHVRVSGRCIRQATGPAGAVWVGAFAQNKANLCPFWPENEGRAEKQSQFSWFRTAVAARNRQIRGTKLGIRNSKDSNDRNAQNKANFRPFWAGNWGGAKKQSQFEQMAGPARSKCGYGDPIGLSKPSAFSRGPFSGFDADPDAGRVVLQTSPISLRILGIWPGRTAKQETAVAAGPCLGEISLSRSQRAIRSNFFERGIDEQEKESETDPGRS